MQVVTFRPLAHDLSSSLLLPLDALSSRPSFLSRSRQFSLLSPPLVLQIPRLDSLQLLGNLVAIIRNVVRLSRLGPELRYGKATLEVGAEIVHYADREENVHAELQIVRDTKSAHGW
jgi:hypothetical protein